jgi:hypothetical protein
VIERRRDEYVPGARMDLSIDQQLRALAAQTLAVERPHEKAMLAVVRGETSPRAAWELLVSRGHLPTTFLTDAHRYFRVSKLPAELSDVDVERLHAQRYATPVRAIRFAPQPAFAAAIAADVQRFVSAEALAREAAARLWPWCARDGETAPSTVVWQSLTREALLSKPTTIDLVGTNSAHDAARAAGGEDWTTERRDGWAATVGVSTVLMEIASPFVLGSRAWRRAREADARVPETLSSGLLGASSYPAPERLRGARFATMPDPFEPMIALWERGFVLLGVGPDAALLAMNPRSSPPTPLRDRP